MALELVHAIRMVIKSLIGLVFSIPFKKFPNIPEIFYCDAYVQHDQPFQFAHPRLERKKLVSECSHITFLISWKGY